MSQDIPRNALDGLGISFPEATCQIKLLCVYKHCIIEQYIESVVHKTTAVSITSECLFRLREAW